MLSAILIAFTIWQSPDGKWTKTGESSSQAAENPYQIIQKWCANPENTKITPLYEGTRLLVFCEAK